VTSAEIYLSDIFCDSWISAYDFKSDLRLTTVSRTYIFGKTGSGNSAIAYGIRYGERILWNIPRGSLTVTSLDKRQEAEIPLRFL
jgi:hypothetical protein